MRVEERNGTDLHRRFLDRRGARWEALYVPFCGYSAIAVTGLAAYFLKQPLPFKGLSPGGLCVLLAAMSEEANPRNAVAVHPVAAVRLASRYAFGPYGEPGVQRRG